MEYLARLESELEILKSERTKLESHVFLFKKKYLELKLELEKLKRPPLAVATVVDVLPDGRVIVKHPNNAQFLVNVREGLQVKRGDRVALSQQSLAVMEVLPKEVSERAKAFEVIERPGIRYSDIGGLDEQIKQVRELVELPLTKPHLFREIGIDPPKGVLLYGPPGTGKTMLAKAVATESKATFMHVVGSEFVQKFIGEGAKLVKEVFELAREKAPSIVFIDEIDAIGAVRSEALTGGDREVQRTLVQLLAELDGFRPLEGVVVMAATNRPDILDPALLRPGRFDRMVYVPLPDKEGRKHIFSIYLRRIKKRGIDVDRLAAMTEGFSGADIKHVVTEAAMRAIGKGKKVVTMKELEEVIRELRPRVEESTLHHG